MQDRRGSVGIKASNAVRRRPGQGRVLEMLLLLSIPGIEQVPLLSHRHRDAL